MFGVYLPCDDHSRSYAHAVLQIAAYIESVLDKHVGYRSIILGDFNFECNMKSTGFVEFSKFANDFNLVHCDHLVSNMCSYTYCHSTLNHQSLIDHVFVSSDISARIHDYKIISDGANLSDHLPVHFQLSCRVSRCHNDGVKSVPKVCQWRWDKGDVQNYYLQSGLLLNKIEHSCLQCTGEYNCTSTEHHLDIEIYYAEIVHCLKQAARMCIPCIPKSALGHYWSEALDELKQNSCVAYDVWHAAAKPRLGDVYNMKKDAHYKYKLAVRDAAVAFESQFSDHLLDHYLQKDMNSFWKSWRCKRNRNSLLTSHVEGTTGDGPIANKFVEYFEACAGDVTGKLSQNVFGDGEHVKYSCSSRFLSVDAVDDAIRLRMKLGKASGVDNVTAEHIVYAHPAIVIHLTRRLTSFFVTLVTKGWVVTTHP